MKKVLVVGNGLAGMCISMRLLEQGCSVTIADNGINHSSAVAAGMINPLVFRRMTKSWRVDEFIPEAVSFYRSLEAKTEHTFFHPFVIRRFFSSVQERQFWEERQDQDDYRTYMTPLSPEDETAHTSANLYGSGRVKQASWVDTKVFLSAVSTLLKTEATFLEETVDYAQLHPEEARYKDVSYDCIVFAEGYLGKNNPWFGTLPLQQTKGETLTVELNDLHTDESLNRKCFLLPLGEHRFKVGSTYVWNTSDLSITEEGRELILNNLRYLTEETAIVTDQRAGVRPTTLDRRPLMGFHPDFPKLALFNGLGTKGYMMAPLLSSELTAHLILGKPLHPECDLNRFKK